MKSPKVKIAVVAVEVSTTGGDLEGGDNRTLLLNVVKQLLARQQMIIFE